MQPVLIPPSPETEQTHLSPNASPLDVISWLQQKIISGREEVTPSDLKLFQTAVNRLNQEGDTVMIPFLNRKYLQATPSSKTCIVRFVGMVQDVLDVEYYSTQVHGRFTKYQEYEDTHDSNEDLLFDTTTTMDSSSSMNYDERQPMLLVPIPYASPWFHDTLSHQNTTEVQVDHNNNQHHPKRSKTMSNPIWPAGILESDASQSAVLAKVYYENDDECSNHPPRNVRLNDLVEIFGVLQGRKEESNVNYRSPYDDSFDLDTFLHPLDTMEESRRSLVEIQQAYDQLPHIHVLSWKTIDMDSWVYPPSLFGSSDFHTRLCNSDNNNDDDDRLLAIQTFATHVFDGDTNASEALLLSLMSMAERDKEQRPIHLPSGATLGCASLKLIAPTLGACSRIRTRLLHVLKAVMPVVACLELTQQSVKSPAQYHLSIPEKSGRLEPSSMQLPKGSCMIVDESQLDARTRGKGYNTVTALSRIARDHSICYNFHGINFDFETDYIVIIISKEDEDMEDVVDDEDEDDAAFSGCSLTCRLSHVGDGLLSSLPVIPEQVSSRIRSYLRSCRKRYPIALSDPELLTKAQNDFIDRRNVRIDTKPLVDEEDFHRWLTMTRLVARSHSKAVATLNDWESSLRLDDAINN